MLIGTGVGFAHPTSTWEGILSAHTNPFRYGDLALDEAFTDRERELDELKSDMRNGQNVVIFAPRRFGKSSLVWRASQELIGAGELAVAQVDLMATPSKEKLAEKLAKSVYEDIASNFAKVREKTIEVVSRAARDARDHGQPRRRLVQLQLRGEPACGRHR